LPAQRGMILSSLRFPDDGFEVIQCTLDWTRPLRPAPFETAWHVVARRHPVLRTAFRWDDRDALVQVVDPDASIDVRWRDLPPPPASGPDEPFESFLLADRRERFDLARGPLVRLTAVRRVAPAGERAADPAAHRTVLTFHHALLDGHSLRLLIHEVSRAYAASLDGRTEPEPAAPSFDEFVRWWHATDSAASAAPFWTDYLADTMRPQPLPGHLGQPVAGTAEPMTAETALSRADSERIRLALGSAGLRSSTMVTAAWALLRGRYGGVTDVVLAVTRSCRRDSIPGSEAIIGPLINTLPLRVRFADEWSVRDLLTGVSDSIRQIGQHQRTPMASALAWAGHSADTALVDCLLMFDRRRLQVSLPDGACAPSSARMDRLPSFPLTLCAFDEPEIRLSLIWDRRRFAAGSVQRMLDQLCATLIELPGKLGTSLGALDLGRTAARAAPEPSAITRKDRSPYRIDTPPAITRKERSTYRVDTPPPAPGRPAALAPHLVHLTGDWALWRTTCLRAAGFPAGLLAALGDLDLARAADAVVDQSAPSQAYAAEFGAAVRRLSAALYQAATRPALREAVTWQNRRALTTGIDVLARRGLEPAKRNAQRRQHEALVASYLQRYCAKNDTIGFFGPVSWSQIDDGPGIRISHAAPGHSLSARATYLEGWAVRAIMTGHAIALRPWLVPRRMPFVGVDGGLLRLPLAPAVPLTPAEAAVLRAVDGIRDAREVAALVLADPSAGLGDVTEVFALMGRLADSRRLAWRLDVAPQDSRPERSVRALLSRVTDEAVRGPAEKALDELAAAASRLAGAAGDADQVNAAMAGLESTFTRLAGVPPTRRSGELYAGRTLAYEECLRGDTVRLGADTLDGIRSALALVLDTARWFTAACAELYARHFDEAYRQRAAALGTGIVPFGDFWLFVNNAVFVKPSPFLRPAVTALRERWSAVLDLPPDARQIRLRSADLRERVRSQFPARPLPWPTAVHHSPDLMISGADAATGGPLTWVLGEIHPSIVTVRYRTWLEFHEAANTLRSAMRHDLPGPPVWLGETAENGGPSARLSNALSSADDLRLVYAHDSCGYDPANAVTVGDCDLVATPAGLRVRRRDGTLERDLLSVVGDTVSTAVLSHSFDLTPAGAHTPRVTIDDLVVSRERWTVAATDLEFAGTTDESIRYLQARAWAAGHGLPRHVFLRFTGEAKPIYADLTSLASIDLISRSLRRSRRYAADAQVIITEMLPAPDQLWLTDAQGHRYTAEMRMVAADQTASGRAVAGPYQEG
jgi:Condensation domain/Lantibiotic dehydratase, N terminus